MGLYSLLNALSLFIVYTQYLSDISQCVSLSRPLVQFCLKKLNNLYKLSQRIESSGILDKQPGTASHTPSAATSSANVKQEKDEDSVAVKVEKLDELDSVFSPAMEDAAGHSSEASHQQRSSVAATPDGTKKMHSTTAGDDAVTTTGSHRTHASDHKPSIAMDQSGESSVVTMETTDQRQSSTKKQDISLFTWCDHHQKLVGLLSCAVQTIALSCTTALVHLPLPDPMGKALVAKEEKDYSLLKNLQFSITNLPIPSGLSSDSRKKQQVCVHM